VSFPYRNALIVGAGPGISAAVAARLRAEGVEVGIAARNVEKLRAPAAAIGAHAFAVDATSPQSVAGLFDSAIAAMGPIEVVLYNAGARVRRAITELDPGKVEQAIAANAFGGFLVAQQAARQMLPRRFGAILFTGATASVKIGPTARSIPMRSLKRTSTSCANRAALGRRRSRFGLGSSVFESGFV
jgi:NAD(P)-dependent dehydrogenase (short-subunit alcohol dehydrogenase family)